MPTKVLNPQLGELVQHFVRLAKQHLANKVQKTVAPLARELFHEAFKQARIEINQRLGNVNQQIENAYQQAYNECLAIIKGPPIKIEVESQKLNSVKNSQPVLIQGKAKFSRPGIPYPMEVDCFVACGHWHKLGELKEKKINILDHLDKLLPPTQSRRPKGPIGLVTFQNGIMNDFENNFRKMAQSIINQFPEGPLCIGLHNPTSHNLVADLARFEYETESNSRAVYSLCQLIKTFADLLPKINPQMVWTHFAHSEGGLIANAVLELCQQAWLRETQKYIKEHLITATYGPVKPIPQEYALESKNTYSNKDIALFFGRQYLDKELDKIENQSYESSKSYQGKTYKVTIINSLTSAEPFLNIKFEQPQILTLEQRLKMSWVEWMAHHHEIEDRSLIGNAINTAIVDKINATAFSITDHGFGEATYQAALLDDIKSFKKDYKVYDAKTFR